MTHDCLIVGGGPAGLSAALHLAFHQRSVVVIDRRSGPLPFTLTPLYNVPGFALERGVDIIRNMEKQATSAGAKLERGNVVLVSGSAGAFVASLEDGREYHAKTLLFATGVARYHPLVAGQYEPFLKYAAKGNSYYCPDCESPELLGKHIVVIAVGSPNSAVAESLPLLEFAASVRLLLTEGTEFKPEWEEKRQTHKLEVLHGKIQDIEGSRGIISALVLQDGSRVTADGFYISSPKFPRNQLALQLGLETSERGHIRTGWRGQTKLVGKPDGEWFEGVWAAGDVQPQTQQVSIAAGSGNIAAVMIDQHLQKKYSRVLGRSHEPFLTKTD
jgi:thioredoxin reductase (NADPH)